MVLTVGDAEVVVGVVVLEHAARRVRRADGEHGRRAVRVLRATDLLDGCHGPSTYVDRCARSTTSTWLDLLIVY